METDTDQITPPTQTPVKKQPTRFCNSRRWTQITSLLLTIWYGLALVGVISFCIKFGRDIQNSEEEIIHDAGDKSSISAAVFGLFLLTMVNVTGFVGGGILVDGVRQGDPRKLKVWIMVSVGSLILYFLHMIFCAFARRYGPAQKKYEIVFQNTDFLFILIAIHFLSIWIVHTHRKELLDSESPNPTETKYDYLEEDAVAKDVYGGIDDV